jgi:hypothetical protein
MSTFKRRHFLQFAGATLASLGLGQLDFERQAQRYAQVLAQGTPRKLALLVGVNQYPPPLTPLQGCLTDVELQYELLVHRYGFNPADIVKIHDGGSLEPTRENILTAFENHLIRQAKPGDVVVFHYSGHGSRVRDPQPIDPSGLTGALVPVDSLKTETQSVNDIMSRTLFLLLLALQTDSVTTVLDSCYAGIGLRGNLVIRAVNASSLRLTDQPASEELDYQYQWLRQLNLGETDLQRQRQQGIARGVAIGSASQNQLATDAPFDGFHAGAFTYLLTRYLWQQAIDAPLSTVFIDLKRATQDVARQNCNLQEPNYEVHDRGKAEQPVYGLPTQEKAAEAVITSVQGDRVQCWLGGITSQNLEAFGEHTLLQGLEPYQDLEVELLDRQGLTASGVLRSGKASTLKAGLLLREKIRSIPNNVKLKLGIDPSLATEAPKIQLAFKSLPKLKIVSGIGNEEVHYLVGQMTADYAKILSQDKIASLPAQGSIGLFTSGLVPIPDSFGPVQESLQDALERLRPRLQALVAGYLLKLLTNAQSSTLRVKANIQAVGSTSAQTRGLGSRVALEGGLIPEALAKQPFQFSVKTAVQVKVQNLYPQRSDRNLYVAVLAITSGGDLVMLFPYWDAPEDAARISPEEEVTIPRPTDSYRFIVEGPPGFMELLLVVSVDPLRNVLRGLQSIATSRSIRSSSPTVFAADEPTAVIESLLADIDQSTRATTPLASQPTAAKGSDPSKLMVLSAIIEVV